MIDEASDSSGERGSTAEQAGYEIRPITGECPRCGYDLRGLLTIAGATCPECGTRSPFHRVRFPGLRRSPLLEAAISLAAPILILLAVGAAMPFLNGVPPHVRFAAAYLVGCLIVRSIGRRWLPKLPWTTLTVVALLCPVVLTMGTWYEQAVLVVIAAVLLGIDTEVRKHVKRWIS